MAKEKKKTFKDFEDLKEHIKTKELVIKKEIDDLNGLVGGAFGAFPKDMLSLVNLIDRVVTLREQGKK